MLITAFMLSMFLGRISRSESSRVNLDREVMKVDLSIAMKKIQATWIA